MHFYPLNADQRLVPIRIDGSPKFVAEVVDILIYLHGSAGTRTSRLIMDGILRLAQPDKFVLIKEAQSALHNAITGAGKKQHGNCKPTKDDPLANPGSGAFAATLFFPWEWAEIGQGSPGASRDEVLLHEMVHAYMFQRGLGNGEKLRESNPLRLRQFTFPDDFYAVMITNVHSSELQRPIRRDHVGFSFLDQTALGLTMDPAFSRYFTALKNHAPDLVARLSKIDTRFNPWNPRHKLHDLLDAQLY